MLLATGAVYSRSTAFTLGNHEFPMKMRVRRHPQENILIGIDFALVKDEAANDGKRVSGTDTV